MRVTCAGRILSNGGGGGGGGDNELKHRYLTLPA